MTSDELANVLKDAEEIAGNVSEPYRIAAFRIAARSLLGGQADVVEPTHAGAAEQRESGEASHETVNELLATLGECSHRDRFVAIIYHGLRQDGRDGLTNDEILEGYGVARIPRPANPSDVIAKCARRGHLMEGPRRDSHRTWRITQTGQRYIREMIDSASGA